MTIGHHISDEVLLSYAAGDLDDATSLVVASHLALCPVCRAAAEIGDDLGGVMLDELPPARMSDDALAHVLALTERPGPVSERPQPAPARRDYVFPEPLRSRIGGDLDAVRWRTIGPGVKQHLIHSPDGESTARLLKIAGGQGVPEHGHTGEEFTLVLAGGFSDGGANFARGDVEWADPDTVHRPVADLGEGCVCLAVTSGPLRFFDVFSKIAQRVIGI